MGASRQALPSLQSALLNFERQRDRALTVNLLQCPEGDAVMKEVQMCRSAFDLGCVGLLSGERVEDFNLAFLLLHA